MTDLEKITAELAKLREIRSADKIAWEDLIDRNRALEAERDAEREARKALEESLKYVVEMKDDPIHGIVVRLPFSAECAAKYAIALAAKLP
jgi:hypothetical protein